VDARLERESNRLQRGRTAFLVSWLLLKISHAPLLTALNTSRAHGESDSYEHGESKKLGHQQATVPELSRHAGTKTTLCLGSEN
jgi:hypothetical protein